MRDRLVSFFTHWDPHVLFVALAAAVAGVSAGHGAIPLQISLPCLATFMLFPEGMLLFRAYDERDQPRRLAKYLISNHLGLLSIAACAFIARRLLFL